MRASVGMRLGSSWRRVALWGATAFACAACTSSAGESRGSASDGSDASTDDAPTDAALSLDASGDVDASSSGDAAHDAPTFCTPGEQVPCYEGPVGTDAFGKCRKGSKRCRDDGSAFEACVGQVLPENERCDTPDDDDCNGLVNEAAAGCVCEPGSSAPCYPGAYGTSGVGACHPGTQVCLATGLGYGACTGAVVPVPTDCASTVDLDCDGRIHDAEDGCCTPGEPRDCYSQPPTTHYYYPCHPGSQLCLDDAITYGPCDGELLPGTETCGDNVDNDCNGLTDESGSNCICSPYEQVACYEGPPATKNVGACRAGTIHCDFGTSQYCANQIRPALRENCATIADDDCDGSNGPSCWSVQWTVNLATGYETNVVPLTDGGAVATSASQNTTYLERFDATGHRAWRRTIAYYLAEGTGYRMLLPVAGTSADTILLGSCSSNSNTSYVGGVTVDCTSGGPIVARFDGTGSLVWVRRIGRGYAVVRDASGDDQGNLYLVGGYRDADDVLGTTLPSPASPNDAPFVLKLDSAGLLAWARGYPVAASRSASTVVAVADGVVFAGDSTELTKLTTAGDLAWTASDRFFGSPHLQRRPGGGFELLSSAFGGSLGSSMFTEGALAVLGNDGSLTSAIPFPLAYSLHVAPDGTPYVMTDVDRFGFDTDAYHAERLRVVALTEAGDAKAQIDLPSSPWTTRLASNAAGELFIATSLLGWNIGEDSVTADFLPIGALQKRSPP